MKNKKTIYPSIKRTRTIDIDEIFSIYYFAYSKTFRFEGERHNFYELVYCDTGEVVISDEDEEFILEAKSAFIHPPNHFHKIRANDCLSNVFIIGFTGNFENELSFIRKKVLCTKTENDLIKQIIFEAKRAFLGPLNTTQRNNFTLNPAVPMGAVQMIVSTAEMLLLHIARKFEAYNDQLDGQNKYSFYTFITEKIISILNENIDNRISILEIAQMLNYSATYIKRIFKSITGVGIIHYLAKLKIEKAKQLLSDPSYSVSAISALLKYDTPQHFSNQFKKIVHMSPTAYRNAVSESDLLI